MTVDLDIDLTPGYLLGKDHGDLLETADEAGHEPVDRFLSEAVEVAREFLGDHGKELEDPPVATFDPTISGVEYDPYHREGEVLSFGGPRGILHGGYQYLSHRDYLNKPSMLTILSKGLLHAYNQRLARARFDRLGSQARLRATPEVTLYDEFKMLAPGADEGITQLFSFHVEAPLTDKDLREGYITEWANWYRQRGEIDADLFEAVALTLSDRIDAADGGDSDRIAFALEIQEPLVQEGDLSVLSAHLDPIEA
jgi:hypothetical protein